MRFNATTCGLTPPHAVQRHSMRFNATTCGKTPPHAVQRTTCSLMPPHAVKRHHMRFNATKCSSDKNPILTAVQEKFINRLTLAHVADDAQCGKSPKKRHFSRFFKEGNLINNFYPR
jgi:hypothetical protein